MRQLARTDLYYLLRYVLNRPDMEREWLYARCREVEGNPNDHLDLWAREHYKLQPLTQLQPTPNGWIQHGDLKPGDELFGPDGERCKVIALNKIVTDAKAYEIEFDDGTTLISGAEHLWQVEKLSRKRIPGTYSQNKIGKRIYRECALMQTREIFAHTHKQDNRLAIRVASPLQLPEIQLPISPYVLGAWLGDGESSTGRITSGDQDIFKFIAAHFDISHDHTPGLNSQCRTVYGLHTRLRNIGVLHNKHIPLCYLRSSVKQRLALLQGLMDTDGSCNDRGTATFVNTNARLIDNVVELANTLGLKPRKRQHIGSVNNKPYPYWQVSFQAYQDFPVFKLKRKLENSKKGVRQNPRRYIVDCREVEPIPMRCIQVDRDDGLYLTGESMVPTHNSTIITYAKSIQDILASHGNDPLPDWEGREATIGIFSHTRPIAKGFLRQIKYDFEANERLRDLFPDICYFNPQRESPKWSEDDGIIVKRKTNPKEATVEAWGLVDGQPTSKHFFIRVYDDVVTMGSVTTPEMIHKTSSAWELSTNLGAQGGHARYIGTRYHYNDTYSDMMDRGVATVRLHPATDSGKLEGRPVFLTRQELEKKRREQGDYTFACQMLLNPKAIDTDGFKEDWIRYTGEYNDGKGLNIYILVDPANEKSKKSDYTVMSVIGLGADKNYYLLDGIRDRLNLTERANVLMELHRRWGPIKVGYEEYGLKADTQYIKTVQNRENYRFEIVSLGGNQLSKNERIKRLIGPFEEGKFYVPSTIRQTNHEKRGYDFVQEFIKEFKAFPFMGSGHDDILDSLSRIEDPDLNALFPKNRNYGHLKLVKVENQYDVHKW